MKNTVIRFQTRVFFYDQIIPYVFSQKSHRIMERFPLSVGSFLLFPGFLYTAAIATAKQNPSLGFCLVEYLMHCVIFVFVTC